MCLAALSVNRRSLSQRWEYTLVKKYFPHSSHPTSHQNHLRSQGKKSLKIRNEKSCFRAKHKEYETNEKGKHGNKCQHVGLWRSRSLMSLMWCITVDSGALISHNTAAGDSAPPYGHVCECVCVCVSTYRAFMNMCMMRFQVSGVDLHWGEVKHICTHLNTHERRQKESSTPLAPQCIPRNVLRSACFLRRSQDSKVNYCQGATGFDPTQA